MIVPWSLSALEHSGFVAAGLLVYVLVTRINRQRRHPSAAIAWVVAIAAFPYAGIPLFLLFGTRKFARPRHGPAPTGPPSAVPGAPAWSTQLLGALDVAPAVVNRAVVFHADGAQSLSALLALCDEAQHTLDVGTFVLGHDAVGARVVEALCAAARRGVSVRLLVDAVGSRNTPRTMLTGLGAGGVAVRRFMPLLHNPLRGRINLRNHRKLAVADGIRLWSGGRNLALEYFQPSHGAPAWIDLSFELTGGVAGHALAQFDQDWKASSGHVPEHVVYDAAPVPPGAGPLAQWVASGPDRADDSLHALLMTAAYHARERILAATPYFVPDDALLEAWCTACQRGVRVVLVLPRRSNHRLADWARARALRRLVEAGGLVYMTETMLHAKAVVIDAELALCGTANLDGRSLFLNFEATTAFYGATEVAWLAQWIECQAQAGGRWKALRPPWWRDIAEGVVRAVGFQL